MFGTINGRLASNLNCLTGPSRSDMALSAKSGRSTRRSKYLEAVIHRPRSNTSKKSWLPRPNRGIFAQAASHCTIAKNSYVVVVQIKSEREVLMNRKWILVVCIANLCALAGSTAVAAVIHYTLNNVNFQGPPLGSLRTPPDGTAVGSFDYDTNSQQISNISITTANIPGMLACYEPNSSTCTEVHYSGSSYISSIPGRSGGATAQLIADPSNANNQQILFQTNAIGGGSVYYYPVGGGPANSAACTANYHGGCTLSLTIPNSSLNGGGVIQLVSEIPNGIQTAPGSADPTGAGVCGKESWVGAQNNEILVRYVLSAPTCGSLSGTTSSAGGGGGNGTQSAGGGLTSLATFALLIAAYMLARVWLRRRGASA